MSESGDESHTLEEPRLSWIYSLKKEELKELKQIWNLDKSAESVENLRASVKEFYLANPWLWTVSTVISKVSEELVTMSKSGTSTEWETKPQITNLYKSDYALQFLSSLKFDNSSSLSADDFLQRINEKRRACRISEADLLVYLPELFQGIPLNWCRLEIDDWNSWNDFEKAFRATFFPRNYEENLKKEIDRRTQGEQENITDFVINVRTLFKKLSRPLSEDEQINKIYNNLLPRYQFYIRRSEATSLSKIVELGQEFENLEERAKTFKAPPSMDKSIFPETAYRPLQVKCESSRKQGLSSIEPGPKEKPNWNKNKNGSKSQNPAPNNERKSPITAKTHQKPKVEVIQYLCWNCLKTGHRYPECPEPRTSLFCYNCGTRGTTKINCPNCSETENTNRAG